MANEKFWERVDQSGGPDACWLWMGPQTHQGYGRSTNGKQPHRIAWVLVGRELIPGLTLDHLCRNRLCVNPIHLEQVTGG